MSRGSIALIVLIPLLFTGAVLAEVAVNRRGDGLREPIVLSERELSLAPHDDDNTAAMAWLMWSDRQRPLLDRRTVRKDLRRRVFVALALDPARAEGSRLVVVDVDADAAVLERRYPNGRTHLITAGTARPDGIVVNLDPVRINVPREMAAELPRWRATRDSRSHPPFTMSLRYGRHWEPWVVEVAGSR
jgi:hypothetical protein